MCIHVHWSRDRDCYFKKMCPLNTTHHFGFSKLYIFFSSCNFLYKNGHYWYSLCVRLSVQVLFKTIGFFLVIRTTQGISSKLYLSCYPYHTVNYKSDFHLVVQMFLLFKFIHTCLPPRFYVIFENFTFSHIMYIECTVPSWGIVINKAATKFE